jgi:hypothetical protein
MRTLGYRRKRFFFIPLILVAVAAFGAITMLLWNALMPLLFHLPAINFWQALGLLLLGRIFFGFGRSSGWWGGNYWQYGLQERLSKMSPQDREEILKRMKRHRHTCYGEVESEPEDGENGNKE